MNFRLLQYQVFDAATNMALDEAILESHRKGLVPPTLRFYGWAPPAVSIGYSQKMDPDTIERIKSEGFDVVRRLTGGRAVLHFAELTYSFIASPPVLSEQLNEAYRQICNGLILGLKHLGVEADLGKSNKQYKDFSDCFMATTQADLQVNSKKMVGSAQLRRQGAVLQHGSILLDQPQNLLPELLDSKHHANSERHSNFKDVAGRDVGLDEMQKAFTKGFSEAFSADFKAGELVQSEKDLLNDLRANYLQ
ncbi:MAG: lipoate--protein ligase family protein [Candidatus Melainabacteria bacterium]|nr:lipoate--protein ligase family protein [Candidatus Melainabacteria bacterium]